jgi:hypothetical protein
MQYNKRFNTCELYKAVDTRQVCLTVFFITFCAGIYQLF